MNDLFFIVEMVWFGIFIIGMMLMLPAIAILLISDSDRVANFMVIGMGITLVGVVGLLVMVIASGISISNCI